MNSKSCIKETMNEQVAIDDNRCDCERIVDEVPVVTNDRPRVPSNDRCDTTMSTASSVVTDLGEYSQPFKKLKLPVSPDVSLKIEESFAKNKSLVAMAFAPEANICFNKFPSVTNAELLMPGLSRKERHRLQIAAVLEEASVVGLAVEELEKSTSEVLSSRVNHYNTTSCIVSQSIEPRRHRPQRRNSFVIHRDRLGFGCPFPIPPATAILSQEQTSLPSLVSVVSSEGPCHTSRIGNVQSEQSFDSSCTESSGMPTQVHSLAATAGESAAIGNNEACNNPKKLSEIDLMEQSCKMENSLVSMWSRGHIASPALSKETKEYYGYE